MARSPRVVLSIAVALSLTAPQLAFARQRAGTTGSSSSSSGSQGSAVPRSEGSSSSSSGSSGSSSGSSASSDRGGGSRVETSSPPPDRQDRPSGRTPSSSGSSTGAKATPRSGASGTASGGSTASGRPSGGSGVIAGSGSDQVAGRTRNGRPVIGSAVARTTVVGPTFVPWRYWSPIYAGGFGWNLGYVSYSPWGYSGFYGGRYGPWYYPYYPYGYYDPYYSPYYPYASGGSYREDNRDDSRTYEHGSLRIKASPSTAKVYVDGTLMGTVDDFNGLSNHLELETGTHRLELKAEGYKTVATDVTVKTSTTTVRLNLKKQ
jgi:hypothetical protein